jgi:aspartate/methionine/tyrosine aminotransferase
MDRVLEKMTEFNISHPTMFVQWGGVAALDHGDAYVEGLVRRYAEAAEMVHKRLSPFATCPARAAAFRVLCVSMSAEAEGRTRLF